MKAVLGIDPGLSGGLVVISPSREVISLNVMPTIGNELDLPALSSILSDAIYTHGIGLCCLERSQSMPKQGVASTFKYGRVCGAIEGMLAVLGIPYTMVEPVKWTKVLHLGLSRDLGPKERSSLAAKRLYPTLDLRASARSVKPHEGLVDALLIATYGLGLTMPMTA
jgi:crossover junction endodeoxyribonuclease RuvC